MTSPELCIDRPPPSRTRSRVGQGLGWQNRRSLAVSSFRSVRLRWNSTPPVSKRWAISFQIRQKRLFCQLPLIYGPKRFRLHQNVGENENSKTVFGNQITETADVTCRFVFKKIRPVMADDSKEIFSFFHALTKGLYILSFHQLRVSPPTCLCCIRALYNLVVCINYY